MPYGRYTKPTLPEKEMFYFYEKSQHAVFEVADFITTVKKAKTGDRSILTGVLICYSFNFSL